jgi:hypothetical protein
VDDSAGGDIGADEARKRGGRGVGQQLQAQAPGAVAADLDRNPDQRLAGALSAAAEVGIAATEEALVDLDLAGERLALRGDHRTTQLVQDDPGGLVTRDPQLTAKLQR